MDVDQPKLCPILEAFEEYFGIDGDCTKWPENFFEKHNNTNDTLEEELHRYAKENLAIVQVVIQSPYVTIIKRDVAMTLTNYVANAGGLLGLCLGCSFISFIEMIFWCCCCCRELKKNCKTTTLLS